MPLTKRTLSHPLTHADPRIYESSPPDKALANVNMAMMTGTLSQLAFLSSYATEIFQDLFDQCNLVNVRLHDAIERTNEVVDSLPELVENSETFSDDDQELSSHHTSSTNYEITVDSQLFQPSSLSSSIKTRYLHESVDTIPDYSPVETILAKYTPGAPGAGLGECGKLYSNPNYFYEQWEKEEEMRIEVLIAAKNERKEERKLRRLNYKKRKDTQNGKNLTTPKKEINWRDAHDNYDAEDVDGGDRLKGLRDEMERRSSEAPPPPPRPVRVTEVKKEVVKEVYVKPLPPPVKPRVSIPVPVKVPVPVKTKAVEKVKVAEKVVVAKTVIPHYPAPMKPAPQAVAQDIQRSTSPVRPNPPTKPVPKVPSPVKAAVKAAAVPTPASPTRPNPPSKPVPKVPSASPAKPVPTTPASPTRPSPPVKPVPKLPVSSSTSPVEAAPIKKVEEVVVKTMKTTEETTVSPNASPTKRPPPPKRNAPSTPPPPDLKEKDVVTPAAVPVVAAAAPAAVAVVDKVEVKQKPPPLPLKSELTPAVPAELPASISAKITTFKPAPPPKRTPAASSVTVDTSVNGGAYGGITLKKAPVKKASPLAAASPTIVVKPAAEDDADSDVGISAIARSASPLKKLPVPTPLKNIPPKSSPSPLPARSQSPYRLPTAAPFAATRNYTPMAPQSEVKKWKVTNKSNAPKTDTENEIENESADVSEPAPVSKSPNREVTQPALAKIGESPTRPPPPPRKSLSPKPAPKIEEAEAPPTPTPTKPPPPPRVPKPAAVVIVAEPPPPPPPPVVKLVAPPLPSLAERIGGKSAISLTTLSALKGGLSARTLKPTPVIKKVETVQNSLLNSIKKGGVGLSPLKKVVKLNDNAAGSVRKEDAMIGSMFGNWGTGGKGGGINAILERRKFLAEEDSSDSSDSEDWD